MSYNSNKELTSDYNQAGNPYFDTSKRLPRIDMEDRSIEREESFQNNDERLFMRALVLDTLG